jgi:hypothetical protein
MVQDQLSNFIFAYGYPVFLRPLLEETILSSLYILGDFVEVNWPSMHEFISELPILFHLLMCLFCAVLITMLEIKFVIKKCDGSKLIFLLKLLYVFKEYSLFFSVLASEFQV